MPYIVLRYPEPEDCGGGSATETADTQATEQQVADTTPEQTPEPPASSETPQNEPNPYILEDEDPANTPEPNKPETQQDEPYAIEWPENYSPNDEFAAIAAREAQKAGLSGAAAGKYTAAMVHALQEHQNAQLNAADAALKEEWGAEYESHLQNAKSFLQQIIKDGALDATSTSFFESPKGMRLMHSLSQYVGESPLAIGKTNSAAEQEWARSAMNDPSHPDYVALHNWNHPRFREVNRRYNKTLNM